MRRLPRSLALALGVILLLFGAGSAAFVGPDNTLMFGELEEPGEAQGLPVAWCSWSGERCESSVFTGDEAGPWHS